MRSIDGLKWNYFDSNAALLLDKIYKFEDKTFELGGQASEIIFGARNTVAVHTTCYEQKSKVMGLKVCVCFSACVCVCMYVCVCIRMCVKNVCMSVCLCIYACVRICVCLSAHTSPLHTTCD